MRKFFAITFVGSILWIAFFSYLMVWWADTIGNTLGIPVEVSSCFYSFQIELFDNNTFRLWD